MAKVFVQKFPSVLTYSGSLAANTAITGSAKCAGYSRLLGFITMSSSSETASGLNIKQSVDGGINWDCVSASDAIATATGSAACSLEILGDAVRVSFKAGATTITSMKTLFQLRPI